MTQSKKKRVFCRPLWFLNIPVVSEDVFESLIELLSDVVGNSSGKAHRLFLRFNLGCFALRKNREQCSSYDGHAKRSARPEEVRE